MTLRERISALVERANKVDSIRSLQLAINEDAEFKREIQSLYKSVFNKSVSGCGNCITDAFFELKHATMEKIELEYILKAGALLKDNTGKSGVRFVSAKNITKELALFHLATNPNAKKLFSKLPQDWEKEVEQYKKTLAAAEKKTLKEEKELEAKENAAAEEKVNNEAENKAQRGRHKRAEIL